MRAIATCFLLLIIPLAACAQIPATLKVVSAEKNGGEIYVSIFNSEKAFKERTVYRSFILNTEDEIVTGEINLPKGQYVFTLFQDSNGNGKLDSNLIGIPKEKFGFTNYEGKNAPGNFNRHRVEINESCNEILIVLYKI